MSYTTRGWYLEDFQVGQEMDSPRRTITEADIVQFAGVSGDYNALHVDAEYARSTPFGERIAHGLLGLSVASGLAAQAGYLEGTVMAFTSLDWRFKRPILIGDTIGLTSTVSRVRPMPSQGGGLVTLQVTVLNQQEEVVQEGTWSLLMRSRAAGSPDAQP